MILTRELTERSFDLIITCVPSKSKNLVVISITHSMLTSLRFALSEKHHSRNDIILSLHLPQRQGQRPNLDWDPLHLQAQLVPDKRRHQSFEWTRSRSALQP